MHGFTSTIVPIPNGCNVNVTDSANFRSIALSSIFVKIFDHVVLQKYHEYFFSSELQFGFTHMCTMILKETLMHYNTNNSTAFCTFLDASKAIDRVRYCKLFRILTDRGLPPRIVRVLICLYTTNNVRVAWNRVESQYFLAVNGVKQGGVMSPVLYLLYNVNVM